MHHVEGGAARIGDHREAADAGDVGRRHQQLAAGLGDRLRLGVDVGDVDIADPAGPGAARRASRSVELEHAADAARRRRETTM